MLVLTRRTGETVVIDGCTEVTVLSVQGGKVRLGITAPASVCVDRQEIHERRGRLSCANKSAQNGGARIH